MVEILTLPVAVLAQVAVPSDNALSPAAQFLTQPAAAILAVVALGALVAIVAIVAGQWSQVRRAEMDAALKQDMLQRGMSVDEIERVLKAAPTPPPKAKSKHCAEGTPSGVAAKMAKEGYDGDHIATVLGALEERGRPLTTDEFEAVRAMVKEGYDGDHIATMIRALPRAAATPTVVPESGHPANVG